MKHTTPIACTLAVILAVTQAAPAMAYGGRGYGHGHGGHGHDGGLILGLFAATAAIAVGTAELVTAPIRALAPEPGYEEAPQQAYAPPPQYYAQAPAYYPPPQYAPPQAYYAPPQYYAAPPVYYGRPYYAR